MKKEIPKGVTEEEYEKWEHDVMTHIKTLPRCELVRICEALNRYEWPDDLPGKPTGWGDMDDDERSLWIHDIFRYLFMEVGNKAFLRYCHKTEYGVTDQEFEDWWDSRRWEDVQEAFNKGYYGRQSYNDNGDFSEAYTSLHKSRVFLFVALAISCTALALSFVALVLRIATFFL